MNARSTSTPGRAARFAALAVTLLASCGDDTGVGAGNDAAVNANNNNQSRPDAAVTDGQAPDAAPPVDAWVRPPGDAFVLPDSGADAFVHPGVTYGPAMVVSNLAMGGGMVGLGPFASVVNSDLSDAVAQGRLLMLIEFLDLDDTTGVINDPDVTLVIYRAADYDLPADPSNNFGGSGQFYVELATATVIPNVAIVNGQMNVPAGTFQYLSVEIPNMGDLLIFEPELQFTVEDDFAGLTAGHIDGAVPGRTLDLLPNDTGIGNADGSLLDMLVTSVFELQPNVDVDGDGQLEQFFDYSPSHPGWDELISRCLDYFGDFDDESCPQRPEIWDGYSISLGFTAVSAEIMGIF